MQKQQINRGEQLTVPRECREVSGISVPGTVTWSSQQHYEGSIISHFTDEEMEAQKGGCLKIVMLARFQTQHFDSRDQDLKLQGTSKEFKLASYIFS